MKAVDLFKALANENRLKILEYLKEPDKYFCIKPEVNPHEAGICVEDIQKVLGLSQSTTCTYMNILKKVDLVTATRYGKWTYYKRNEAKIAELAQYIKEDL